MNSLASSLKIDVPPLCLDSPRSDNSTSADSFLNQKTMLSDRLDKLNTTVASMMHEFSLECSDEKSGAEWVGLNLHNSLASTAQRLQICADGLPVIDDTSVVDCSTVQEEDEASQLLMTEQSEGLDASFSHLSVDTLIFEELEGYQMALEDYRSHELRREAQLQQEQELNDEMFEAFFETAGARQYELEQRIEELNSELAYYRSISKTTLHTASTCDDLVPPNRLSIEQKKRAFNITKLGDLDTRENYATMLEGQKAMNSNLQTQAKVSSVLKTLEASLASSKKDRKHTKRLRARMETAATRAKASWEVIIESMQTTIARQTAEQTKKDKRTDLEMESMKNQVTLLHGKKAIEEARRQQVEMNSLIQKLSTSASEIQSGLERSVNTSRLRKRNARQKLKRSKKSKHQRSNSAQELIKPAAASEDISTKFNNETIQRPDSTIPPEFDDISQISMETNCIEEFEGHQMTLEDFRSHEVRRELSCPTPFSAFSVAIDTRRDELEQQIQNLNTELDQYRKASSTTRLSNLVSAVNSSKTFSSQLKRELASRENFATILEGQKVISETKAKQAQVSNLIKSLDISLNSSRKQAKRVRVKMQSATKKAKAVVSSGWAGLVSKLQTAMQKQTEESGRKEKRASMAMESMKNQVTLLHGKNAIESVKRKQVEMNSLIRLLAPSDPVTPNTKPPRCPRTTAKDRKTARKARASTHRSSISNLQELRKVFHETREHTKEAGKGDN